MARFNTAASSLYTCVSITAIASVDLYGINGLDYGYGDGLFVTAVLTGVQIVASLALFATVWLIRRRPDVFRPNGKVVDSLKTGTLWERYSFSWSLGMLNAAGTEKFENSDMPSMDHTTRSENSTADFKRMIFREDKLPLWAHITWKYRWMFLYQWSMILFTNFFDVAPAFANLQLLRYLETRSDSGIIDPVAWKWVAAIVVATISSRLVDSRVMWSEMAGMKISLVFSTSIGFLDLLIIFA